MVSYQRHASLGTLAAHVFGPDAGLDFADMCLVEQHHAQSALPDTASDTQRQLSVEQLTVEVELLAVFLALEGQLAQQGFLVYADAHG